MYCRDWCGVGTFPGVREFTKSNAIIEKIGEPF